MIEVTIHDGREYFTATARGVEYTASREADGWGVWSRRLALGRRNVGSFKRYASAAELAAACRAFRGLDALISDTGARA